MKISDWVKFMGMAVLALATFTGCGGDGGDDDGSVILIKGQNEYLPALTAKSVTGIPNPGTGTMTALISWEEPVVRIEAYFTVAGPGTIIGQDLTTDSPFEISCQTTEGTDYLLYLENHDGMNAAQVDYTISFIPD